MLDDLSAAVGRLSGHYQQAITQFEKWRDKTEKRGAKLRQDLSDLHDDDSSNKYELSNDTLDSYLKAQRTEENRLRASSDRLAARPPTSNHSGQEY